MLDIAVPEAKIDLKHGDAVFLMGSCFSDNLTPYFENSGFKVLSNPFGTIFHPLAIATILNDALDGNTATKALNRDDLWFDWRASGAVYAKSEEALSTSIKSAFSEVLDIIDNAKLLVITFGTSWEYQLEDGYTVGNCHKQPSSVFTKSLTSFEDLRTVWAALIQRLKRRNPNLALVFTVSPVRHLKDGLIENNRSKARLIELVHSFNEAHYFPAYEIVLDVLRDYRFFKEDLVHPNSQAIKVVWSHFSAFVFSDEIRDIAAQVEKVNTMSAHVPLYEDSKAHAAFMQQLEVAKSSLQSQHPSIYWKK